MNPAPPVTSVFIRNSSPLWQDPLLDASTPLDECGIAKAAPRMGVKPLYWAHVGDLVVFASELKAMLASGLVEPELDVQAIDLYLTLGFLPGPRTPLVGVRKLAPGSILLIGRDELREEPYWVYPEPSPDRRPRHLEDYTEELLHLLRQTVRDRQRGDARDHRGLSSRESRRRVTPRPGSVP
jgi:hypothetical protein